MLNPQGMYGPPQGMFGQLSPGGMFGGVRKFLGNNSNALLMAGLGMLSGRNPQEGFGNAMQGIAGGSEMDTKRQERDKLSKAEEARLNALRSVMDDPNGPAAGLGGPMRDLMVNDTGFGMSVLKDRMKPQEPDMPNSYDEFDLAQGNPEYSEFLDRNKPSTTINMGQERAYDSAVGRAFAKDYIDLQLGARQSSTTLGKLDRLGQALSAPGVYTGAGGATVAALKRAATGLGFDVEGVGETDLAASISNELALQLRNPAGGAGMPGAMSDKDREFLMTIPPGLTNTPDGNAQKLEMLKRVNQRSIDVAELANKYQQENGQIDGGFYKSLAQWAEQNPLFPEAAMQPPPSPLQPASPQSAAPVPGTVEDGFRFKGGDPKDPNNWEPVI